jgi:hypothetical protein
MDRDKTSMIKSALELRVEYLEIQLAELLAKEKPTRLKRPELDDIKSEAIRIGLPPLECEAFFNFYESNGWKVGRNPMKNWKAALANWKRNYKSAQVRKESTWELTQKLNIIKEEMSQLKSFGGMTDAFGFRWTDDTKRKRYQQLKVDRDALQDRITKT